jgi:hypothetical protein
MKLIPLRIVLHSTWFLMFSNGAHGQITGTKFVVPPSQLCVTEGEIRPAQQTQLSVGVPKMRAYINGWTSQAIEAQFTYLGPTANQSRLGSGEVRQQFGLKLRAQNACNLVYAMWRFEPESKVVVSVKRNPQQSTSSECGNHGYQNIKPAHGSAVPAVRPGSVHTFSAEFHGNELRVSADGRMVWQGEAGPDAADLKGPVGIRSDNVRLSLDLQAGVLTGQHPHFLQACKSGPAASD